MLDQMFGFYCNAAVRRDQGLQKPDGWSDLVEGWTVKANKTLLDLHHFKATSLNVCFKKKNLFMDKILLSIVL